MGTKAEELVDTDSDELYLDSDVSADNESWRQIESLRRPRLKLEFERPSGGEKSEFDSNSLLKQLSEFDHQLNEILL